MFSKLVGGETNVGGQNYMEDYIVLESAKGQAFLAVFNGHGGKEVAKYARDNLWATIKASNRFESDDPVNMAQAIAAGFVQIQENMRKLEVSNLW